MLGVGAWSPVFLARGSGRLVYGGCSHARSAAKLPRMRSKALPVRSVRWNRNKEFHYLATVNLVTAHSCPACNTAT